MITPVNFKIAKLLKEKGFIFRQNETYYNPVNGFTKYEEVTPTIVEVVMWLYEKHEIWISVVPYKDEELSQTLWENKIIHISDDYNDCSDFTFYHSPEEAYEAAIEYTLKNLI